MALSRLRTEFENRRNLPCHRHLLEENFVPFIRSQYRALQVSCYCCLRYPLVMASQEFRPTKDCSLISLLGKRRGSPSSIKVWLS